MPSRTSGFAISDILELNDAKPSHEEADVQGNTEITFHRRALYSTFINRVNPCNSMNRRLEWNIVLLSRTLIPNP
jgi:hypothetical protein